MKLAALLLVAVGTAVLGAALVPIRRLMALLPAGRIRSRWYVLSALIFLFVAGYVSYFLALLGEDNTRIEPVVPAIFFLGAVFVWLVGGLSLQTAADIRRVAVLEHETITDHLTGLFNRRYVERRLKEEWARAKRHGLPLSVLLLDLDHFKGINDTHGHAAGDLVLSEVGKLLLETVRETDVVARYGGEEIIVIAPNTSIGAAHALAERLRQRVEGRQADLASGRPADRVAVTVSVGAAAMDPGDREGSSLVRRADVALYRAKQAGRNRTVVHGEA